MVTVAWGPDELDPQPATSAGTSATRRDETGARRRDGRDIGGSLRGCAAVDVLR